MSQEMCKKLVHDMHYEARIACVQAYYSTLNIKVPKAVARDKVMHPWQYKEVASFLYHRFVDRHLVSLICVFGM